MALNLSRHNCESGNLEHCGKVLKINASASVVDVGVGVARALDLPFLQDPLNSLNNLSFCENWKVILRFFKDLLSCKFCVGPCQDGPDILSSSRFHFEE